MPKRYAPLVRRYGLLSSFAIVFVVAAFLLLGMSHPSVVRPVPATPTVAYTAIPESTDTPTVRPTATPEPADTPTTQPTAEPTAIPTAAPDVLPDPAPDAQPPPTETPEPAPAATRPSTARAPKGTPTADPNILPNGVRYGDHRPNLPSRIVRIASPNIKLDAKVYEVYAIKGAWEVAEYAAGHHFNTNNPGEGGNIVLNGHNNWKGEVFRYLEFMKVGDLIQVWTLDGKEHRYRVAETKKLKEAGVPMAQRIENGKVMLPTDHEQLTLITCWPYTTYTHRLVIIALPEE
jgi:sortase A